MWLPPTFAVGTNFVEALKTTLIWGKVKFEIQLFPNLCSNSDNIGERRNIKFPETRTASFCFKRHNNDIGSQPPEK